MTSILNITFKPQEDDDVETMTIIHDSSNIPDYTEGRRTRNNDKKNLPESATASAGSTDITNTRKATEKPQHTINFDDKEHY